MCRILGTLVVMGAPSVCRRESPRLGDVERRIDVLV